MKRIAFLCTILTLSLSLSLLPPPVLPQEKPTTWEVYFSPKGGCTDAIVRELDKASSSVLVQAYSFTSYKIAKVLLDAHKRGIKVEVILDKSQKTDQYSSTDFLANSGIPTKIDAAHPIAHNKVMIIDGETVITRSFNFTRAAEDNSAENLLVTHDRELC
jgi:phosphatidylserine/phosphatidylglycerophosphate/cardiolipin synthase-like enzyme